MPEAQFRAMQAKYEKSQIPHVTIAGIEKKSCATCAKLKPLAEFRQDLNRWDKLQVECGSCRDELWAVRRVEKWERRRPVPLTDPRARQGEEDKLALADGWREIHERLGREKAAALVAKVAQDRRVALGAVVVPPARLSVYCRSCHWKGKVENRGLASKCRHCGSLDLEIE